MKIRKENALQFTFDFRIVHNLETISLVMNILIINKYFRKIFPLSWIYATWLISKMANGLKCSTIELKLFYNY